MAPGTSQRRGALARVVARRYFTIGKVGLSDREIDLYPMAFHSQRTVVVVDAGGREAVLVDKYVQSDRIAHVISVPGSDPMGRNSDKPFQTSAHFKRTDIHTIVELIRRAIALQCARLRRKVSAVIGTP